MNEPVIVRNSIAIAAVALLQAILPALIAVGSLYSLIAFFGLIDTFLASYFHIMALVMGALALLILQAPRSTGGQILPGPLQLAFGVLVRWGVLLGVLLAIAYAIKFSEEFPRRVVLTWAVVTPGLLIVANLVLNGAIRRLMCDPLNARRVIFAGCNDVSRALAKQLTDSQELCMRVAGFFDDRGADRLNVNGDVRLLGKLADLSDYVKKQGIQVIFIALPVRHMQRVTDLLDDLRDTTASIYYVPDILVFDLIQARSGTISGIPVIAMCETPFYGYRGVIKRLTDIAISATVLTVMLPLMIGIAIAIRMSSPGPVMFRQRRYGLNGEEITVYKFRTMTVVEDGAVVTQATKDDARTTRLGRFLRRSSLDELPQLLNVLQGRMSLVGPRPHAVAHNEMYRKLIKGYMVRHKVLPGITGLAQVNGLRGETRTVEQMEARVKYDLEYLRNWSVAMDLQILAKTAVRVLHDRNAF